MDRKIRDAIESIGLTKGEITVYLSLLELGETTTGPLIKKSNITGSKVYEILNRLIKKGFVGFCIKNNIKHFSPADPSLIIEYIKKKEDQLKEIKEKTQETIPLIKNILKRKQKSQQALVFEGWKGISTVFNMILENLSAGDEYYAFTLVKELHNRKTLNFLRGHHAKRIKRKIKVKIIANPEDRRMFEPDFSGMQLLEIKYYSNPLPVGVFIFKDYVATFTLKENPIAFVIKSERISDYYKEFFEGLWKKAKK